MGGGMDEEEEKFGGEQNGSCPTDGWVGKHEQFGELKKKKKKKSLPVVIDNMLVCTQQI